jgi:hypothetical protein
VRTRPALRDDLGERLRVPAHGVEARGRHAEPGVEELAQIRPGERGDSGGRGVGAHQRQPIASVQVEAVPACQCETDLPQDGEVAGADAAEIAQHG